MSFPGGSVIKNLPAMQETQVLSLGWEDPLEEEMATYSSIFAWRIPWTEEPGRLQYMGLQKSWTRLSDSHSLIISYWYNIKEIEKNLQCDNSKDLFFF